MPLGGDGVGDLGGVSEQEGGGMGKGAMCTPVTERRRVVRVRMVNFILV